MFTRWIILCFVGQTFSYDLKLVNVIFSHKFYAPLKIDENRTTTLPKILDYKYFLENTYDMVNSDKLDLFNIGVFLRNRYDNFLGDIYYPDIMQMRTSEYILSMVSGLLVDAGLWPPADVQKWKEDLDWQPIPTNYIPAKHDTLLVGAICPYFIGETEKVYKEMAPTIPESLFQIVYKNLKIQIKTPSDVEMLYSCFRTMVDHNLTLPDWAEEIYSNGEMMNLTLTSYDLLTYSNDQKKLNGGTLLKKIFNTTGEHKKSNGTSGLKISMFSGEERNVISVLQTMDLWSRRLLSPIMALLFEVYADDSNEYFIKMFYYNVGSSSSVLESLTLKNCSEYCKLDDFIKQMQPYLPEDEKTLCNTISSASTIFLHTYQYYLHSILLFTIILNSSGTHKLFC